MSHPFTRRAYGCAVVKAVNANYNADFTHQPRTLPDGTVYATDKAFKFLVKNWIVDQATEQKVLYYKTFKDNMQPRALDEARDHLFPDLPSKLNEIKGDKKEKSKQTKKLILASLLQCVDVRLFGATYAGETNISIHGPVQITHGMNRYPDGQIYSEQIQSPFRNQNEKSEDSDASTLGTQSRLSEGHYVHHFSVNPHNLRELGQAAGMEGGPLTEADVELLKEGMRCGATYYDSASKAGVENELLFWVSLKEGSRLVLPSFVNMVEVSKENGKPAIDMSAVAQTLGQSHVAEQVESAELYVNEALTQVKGLDALPFDVAKKPL